MSIQKKKFIQIYFSSIAMKALSLFESLLNTHSGCYHAREKEAVTSTPLLHIYTCVVWGSGISVLPKNIPRLRWPDSNPQSLDHVERANHWAIEAANKYDKYTEIKNLVLQNKTMPIN